MPITLLDMIVLAVMLLSGLLAMIRGFMREILSIAAWATAAIATLYAFPRLLPQAKAYFNNDTIATIAVIAGVFIGTLVIATIITSKISDMVLDSRIGALDRTLGLPVRPRPRPPDRRGGLPVLRTGSFPTSSSRTGCARQNRCRAANRPENWLKVDVAGRPGRPHLEDKMKRDKDEQTDAVAGPTGRMPRLQPIRADTRKRSVTGFAS